METIDCPRVAQKHIWENLKNKRKGTKPSRINMDEVNLTEIMKKGIKNSKYLNMSIIFTLVVSGASFSSPLLGMRMEGLAWLVVWWCQPMRWETASVSERKAALGTNMGYSIMHPPPLTQDPMVLQLFPPQLVLIQCRLANHGMLHQ